MDTTNSTLERGNPQHSEPRVVDGRGHDFFIVDNPIVDQRIELIEEKRRADAGWIYAILCRKADNATGRARVALKYLMKKSGRSKPIVIDALKWLRKVELVKIETKRVDGRQVASEYELVRVDRLDGPALALLRDRVNSRNPEPRVQSKETEDTGSRAFTAKEEDSLEKEDSKDVDDDDDAREHEIEKSIVKQATQATQALYDRIRETYGWRMTEKQQKTCYFEFVEIQSEDLATFEELIEVVDRTIATIPRLRAGLNAYGPVRAIQDVRNDRASARESSNGSGARDGASDAISRSRRREGYEEVFDKSTPDDDEEIESPEEMMTRLEKWRSENDPDKVAS